MDQRRRAEPRHLRRWAPAGGARFPDYRWELSHLLIDGDWIAAHFVDTGTHRDTAFGMPATGRAIRTQEFAFYRIEAGKIIEVWVTADDLHLLTQLQD